jgi:hypothetical protein
MWKGWKSQKNTILFLKKYSKCSSPWKFDYVIRTMSFDNPTFFSIDIEQLIVLESLINSLVSRFFDDRVRHENF